MDKLTSKSFNHCQSFDISEPIYSIRNLSSKRTEGQQLVLLHSSHERSVTDVSTAMPVAQAGLPAKWCFEVDANDNANKLMFSKYNIFQVHHISFAC